MEAAGGLARHDLGARNRRGEAGVVAVHETAQPEPQDERGGDGEEDQQTEFPPQVALIGTGDGRAQRADGMRRRQPGGASFLEELGQQRQGGVGTAGARDLDDEEDDGDGLARVVESDDEGVDKHHKHECDHPAHDDELYGVLWGDLDEEDKARRHERGLDKCDKRQGEKAAEEDGVAAHRGLAAAVGALRVGIDEHTCNERAHPQSERGVERRHRRAKGLHSEDSFAVQPPQGRGQAGGGEPRIVADDARELIQVARLAGVIERGIDALELGRLCGEFVRERAYFVTRGFQREASESAPAAFARAASRSERTVATSSATA